VDRANLSSLEDGQPLPDSSTVLGTFVIVAVAGDNPEELAEADWLVAGDSAWVAIKYGSASSILWDNVVGAPDFLTDAQGSIDGDSKQYLRKNGAWVESTGDSPWEVNGDDIYYNDGNVGIGVSDPDAELEVQSAEPTLKISNDVAKTAGEATIGQIEFAQHFGTNSSSSIKGIETGSSTSYVEGGLTFSTNPPGGSLTERLRIDSAGNVGIGTDDPSHLLDIYGNANTAINMKHYQSGSSRIYFESTSDGRWGAIHAGNNVSGDSGNTKRISISAAEQNGDARFGGLEVGKESMVLGGAFAPNYDVHVTGKMGIGTDAPSSLFEVRGSNESATFRGEGSQIIKVNFSDSPSSAEIDVRNAGDFFISKQGSPVVTINNAGNVGIGMNSLRSTAKEQLAEWKASFDARLKTEPKADKKAVTLEITDDAFEVLPTEEALAQWMETRAAGDKLQVNGNGSFSGKVRASDIELSSPSGNQAWIDKQDASLIVHAGNGSELELKGDTFRLKTPSGTDRLTIDAAGDAHFSGTVNADKEIRTDFFLKTNAWRSKDNKSGLFLSGPSINPINYADGGQNGTSDGETSLGSAGSQFKDAHFSDTVRAGAFASPNNGYGVIINSSGQISPCIDIDNLILDQGSVTHTIGTNRNGGKFKDGWFSGTVNANKFVGDGSGLTGLPSGGMEYDIDQPFTITTPEFYGEQPHSLVINHGKTTAPTTGTVAVQINSQSGAGIQFNNLDSSGSVSNQVSFGLSTVTVTGGKDPVFLVGSRKITDNNGGNVDLGGAYQYASLSYLRNIRISGAYSGTNVTFRDSAGVTARDLIDVFVALKDAVSNVNESDPVAAMASMRSAITATSDSLIQKFEAIHEAVADELEVRKIAMMEPPEEEETETIQ
jgi:hypothetical protein